MSEFKEAQTFEQGAEAAEHAEALKQFVEQLESEHDKAEHLGRGRTSLVWTTEDPFLHSRICIKELHNPEPSVNSFKEEIEIHHAAFKEGIRVPRPLMYVETDAGQYIFMEQIEGRTMKEARESGDLLEREEWDHVKKQLEEVTFRMHKQAFIHHRDLHEGNVMLTEDLEVVLIDFGDAKKVTSLDSDNDIYRERRVKDGRFETVTLPRDRDILQTDLPKLLKKEKVA